MYSRYPVNLLLGLLTMLAFLFAMQQISTFWVSQFGIQEVADAFTFIQNGGIFWNFIIGIAHSTQPVVVLIVETLPLWQQWLISFVAVLILGAVAWAIATANG